MVPVLVHTTLIRDQNGLGFSIAGGEGSPSFKDNSDVSDSKFIISMLFLLILLYILVTYLYNISIFLGNIHFENNGWRSCPKGRKIISWGQSNICKYVFIEFHCQQILHLTIKLDE